MITFIEAFKRELLLEAEATKKMLAIVPADKMDFKPHPKSMDLKTLSNHLAEIPTMVPQGLLHDKWDFAETEYVPGTCQNAEELLAKFNESVDQAISALNSADDSILQQPWTMCQGETVFFSCEKWETFRHAMGQNAHHRAQLGVYLRLLNISIPGVYGPSADEMEMTQQ